jgi:hypothetical protein
MDAAFVLVHSPLLGPSTWAPVARELEAAGVRVAVPSLTHVADADPPFWRVIVDTVTAAVDRLPRDRAAVLVGHSNAGLFLPAIVEAATRRVAGCVFVDARLPLPDGPARVTPPEFLDFLRPKVTGGRGRPPARLDRRPPPRPAPPPTGGPENRHHPSPRHDHPLAPP